MTNLNGSVLSMVQRSFITSYWIYSKKAGCDIIEQEVRPYMEKKLALPVVTGESPPAKWLSMDDYIRFVFMNLRLVADKEAIKRQREKTLPVNVRFEL